MISSGRGAAARLYGWGVGLDVVAAGIAGLCMLTY